MNPKTRIALIKLEEKINANKNYAEQLGIKITTKTKVGGKNCHAGT